MRVKCNFETRKSQQTIRDYGKIDGYGEIGSDWFKKKLFSNRSKGTAEFHKVPERRHHRRIGYGGQTKSVSQSSVTAIYNHCYNS
jgi:hypothetical protein